MHRSHLLFPTLNIRKLFPLFCLICCFGVSERSARACECPAPPATAWVEMNQRDVVLIGRVIEVRKIEDDKTDDLYASDAENKIAVTRSLKGGRTGEVVIRSHLSGCGKFLFEKDKTYLIYADSKATGEIWVISCPNRTKLLKDAAADFQEIEKKKEAVEYKPEALSTLP